MTVYLSRGDIAIIFFEIPDIFHPQSGLEDFSRRCGRRSSIEKHNGVIITI